jgi:hypothetical protein
MRLQEQLAIIRRALPLLGVKVEWLKPDNLLHAKGKAVIAHALRTLGKLPYFEKEVGVLLAFHTFSVDDEEIVLDSGSHAVWQSTFPLIGVRLRLLHQSLELAVAGADQHSIAVRLPDTTSLEGISTAISDVEQILRPVLEAKGAGTTISVRGFDTGSMWVVIALGSAAALIFVRNICNAAKEILAVVLEVGRSGLSLKRMGVEAALLEAIQGQLEEKRPVMVRKLAEKIEKQEFGEVQDNERIGRIGRSIDLLAKLYQKGAEIRPAIESVKEEPEGEQYPNVGKLLEKYKAAIENLETKLLGPTSDSADSDE